MAHLLIAWLVMGISLYIISKIPLLGVEIKTFEIALVSAAVFGILNALVRPVLAFLTFPITILTLGLFVFVLNGIIFALAAAFVNGFTLKNGFLSAIFGSITLTVVYGFLRNFLG